MRRRIYWLLPDLVSARGVMGDLLQARVDERHVHFVAREGSDLSGLHAANVLQTSNVLQAAEKGLVIGAAEGGMLGAFLAVYPIVGDAPQWVFIPAFTILGAVFCAWAASMVGISTPSKRLQRFAAEVARGRILLMVDLPAWRVTEVEAQLEARHPEAHLEGGEPDTPAFR